MNRPPSGAPSGSDPVPGRMAPEPFRISDRRRETENVFTLELVPRQEDPDGFSFEPGQFNMLYLFGSGEVPISIASDRSANAPLLHTIRVAGRQTKFIEKKEVGDTLGVRGPFGSSWPLSNSAGGDLLMVAGGIGLAPLRTALEEVLADRARWKNVTLVYGARSPEHLLYEKELEQWSNRDDLQVLVTVDTADRSWNGNVGVVTDLIPRVDVRPDRTTAFTCGPEIMMGFVIEELRKTGVPTDRIHVSMERNMECAVGFCGHCQFGPEFICRDGPVFSYDRVERFFPVRNF